jgi:hypothetical protein
MLPTIYRKIIFLELNNYKNSKGRNIPTFFCVLVAVHQSSILFNNKMIFHLFLIYEVCISSKSNNVITIFLKIKICRIV